MPIGRLAGGGRQNVDLAVCHYIQGVSCIARMKENLTIVEVAGADERKNSFDFFRRQTSQQLAFREQLDRLLRILLLAP